MIVDAHHHFWQTSRGDYGWIKPGSQLDRDYLPDDLRPVLRRAGVDRTVLVQAAQTEAETWFLLDLADRTDFVAGVVGWLDFEDADFAHKLDALQARRKFVGLRPVLQDLADDAYILRPKVLENLRIVAARDLPFDILTFPRHLPHILIMLEQVPGLRGVIDHISKPPIAAGRLAGWAEDLARVAAYPHIRCKLSGMVTEADLASWKPADLAPFIRHAFAVFEPDRVMFGSDWPVCLLAGSYAEVLNALRTALGADLDSVAMAKVFGGNAVEFYKLMV